MCNFFYRVREGGKSIKDRVWFYGKSESPKVVLQFRNEVLDLRHNGVTCQEVRDCLLGGVLNGSPGLVRQGGVVGDSRETALGIAILHASRQRVHTQHETTEGSVRSSWFQFYVYCLEITGFRHIGFHAL